MTKSEVVATAAVAHMAMCLLHDIPDWDLSRDPEHRRELEATVRAVADGLTPPKRLSWLSTSSPR